MFHHVLGLSVFGSVMLHQSIDGTAHFMLADYFCVTHRWKRNHVTSMMGLPR
jgi:hypothetical protein